VLTGLFLMAASGAVLSDIPLLQDVLLGAGAELMWARLFLVVVENRDGRPLSDIYRHRLDAFWIVVGIGLSGLIYMLVEWVL
jgi:hypothetical protein